MNEAYVNMQSQSDYRTWFIKTVFRDNTSRLDPDMWWRSETRLGTGLRGTNIYLRDQRNKGRYPRFPKCQMNLLIALIQMLFITNDLVR